MATEADMKRWETLTSRINMANFQKREDAIFKSYNSAEKALFNKYEAAEKALLKKYSNVSSGTASPAVVKSANAAADKLQSSYTKQYDNLQKDTVAKDKVSRKKALSDDDNVKRYGKDAMKGKSFATMRPVDAGASRKPTQKSTKK